MAAWEIAVGSACVLMFLVACRDYAERHAGSLTTGDLVTYFGLMFGAFWFVARLWGFQ